MTLLLLFALLLLPVSVLAQVVPASPNGITNPVTQFRGERFGYQFDSNLNSTTFYDGGSGMIGYTSRSRDGRVISEGTVYDSIRILPLEAPASIVPPLTGPPYGSSNRNSIADGPIFSR